MSSLLDIQEEEASEITLSTASLLGIFFGLVLICAVFFGFGYSMGRGSERGTIASGSGSASPTDQANETPAEQFEKSSALTSAEQQEVMQPPARTALSTAAGPKPDSVEPDAPAASTRAEKAPSPAAAPQSAADAAAPSAPKPSAADSGSAGPMVQIAAVARQEDADVLVSALRQRGYGVVVRSDPQDKLLHVQVGPFADRTAATAIKQKLLSDGYNAIIKQ
jgi:DedD protein